MKDWKPEWEGVITDLNFRKGGLISHWSKVKREKRCKKVLFSLIFNPFVPVLSPFS